MIYAKEKFLKTVNKFSQNFNEDFMKHIFLWIFLIGVTKQVRMLAKLGFKSMSFRDRTRIDARFPRNFYLEFLKSVLTFGKFRLLAYVYFYS